MKITIFPFFLSLNWYIYYVLLLMLEIIISTIIIFLCVFVLVVISMQHILFNSDVDQYKYLLVLLITLLQLHPQKKNIFNYPEIVSQFIFFNFTPLFCHTMCHIKNQSSLSVIIDQIFVVGNYYNNYTSYIAFTFFSFLFHHLHVVYIMNKYSLLSLSRTL